MPLTGFPVKLATKNSSHHAVLRCDASKSTRRPRHGALSVDLRCPKGVAICTSRLDVANYLSANLTRFGGSDDCQPLHQREKNRVVQLGACLVPVLERMRRLNWEGTPLLAHQVYTAMRELLHQLEAASTKSWCECEDDTTLSAVHDRLRDAGVTPNFTVQHYLQWVEESRWRNVASISKASSSASRTSSRRPLTWRVPFR